MGKLAEFKKKKADAEKAKKQKELKKKQEAEKKEAEKKKAEKEGKEAPADEEKEEEPEEEEPDVGEEPVLSEVEETSPPTAELDEEEKKSSYVKATTSDLTSYVFAKSFARF